MLTPCWRFPAEAARPLPSMELVVAPGGEETAHPGTQALSERAFGGPALWLGDLRGRLGVGFALDWTLSERGTTPRRAVSRNLVCVEAGGDGNW